MRGGTPGAAPNLAGPDGAGKPNYGRTIWRAGRLHTRPGRLSVVTREAYGGIIAGLGCVLPRPATGVNGLNFSDFGPTPWPAPTSP
jgi:hypothetical protein